MGGGLTEWLDEKMKEEWEFVGSSCNNASQFTGNLALCGKPLLQKCPGDETNQSPPANDDNRGKEVVADEFMKWFCTAMGIGFSVFFWGVSGALLLKRSWRHAYFRFLDESWDCARHDFNEPFRGCTSTFLHRRIARSCSWVHNRSSLSNEFVLLVHVFAGATSSFTLATSSSSTTTRGKGSVPVRWRRWLAGGAAVEAVAASWLTDGESGGATAFPTVRRRSPGLLLLFRFLEIPIGFKFSQASQFWVFGGCFLSSVNWRAWLHRGAKERVEEWVEDRLSRRASLGFGSAAGGRPASSVGGPPAWGLGRLVERGTCNIKNTNFSFFPAVMFGGRRK
ncbi:hypothetical protein NC653_034385 [Populus alba x Populus x berolinensis]|uniref:Uncharacterized protein n=1 Tax=Populus alba x Populus x berolinensis TaxID=444605 RepID=A0AAD6LMJ8_9ROSI|nr:hypothetical protein NC653_034385 [Populus alba x Populus x berolinensis]